MSFTAIVLNPNAGSAAGASELIAAIRSRPDTRVFETERAGHGTELVRAALDDGASLLVAAGGDGTAHEVASALADHARAREVPLAILPLGTGNDLPLTFECLPAAIRVVVGPEYDPAAAGLPGASAA